MDRNIIIFNDGGTLIHEGEICSQDKELLYCVSRLNEASYIIPLKSIKYIEIGKCEEADITDLHNAVNDLLTYMDDLTQGADHINMCIGLIKRYCNGDRTQVLYDQIMEVVTCNTQ